MSENINNNTDNNSYKIKLDKFEGPFDLLLFFIERDELDIYNIPINTITQDFLHYIHQLEELNIEQASEFILFVSTLMRIKAKMLIPRKEIDEQGNEIDPRQELIDKILEYKRYKQAAIEMAEQEANRLLMLKRGNIAKDLVNIGETTSEGTEVQTITLFKLSKTFERIMQRMKDRGDKPQHVVYKYEYTMENSRVYMMDMARYEKTMAFEKIFDHCRDRVHAIFLFLSMLELVQMNHLGIMVGEGRNNFIIEYITDMPLEASEGDEEEEHEDE